MILATLRMADNSHSGKEEQDQSLRLQNTDQINQESQDNEVRVEPAQEAKEPPPPDVVQLCRDTFQKTAEYLRGEMEGTIEDYKLLETMNRITITKYSEMKHLTLNISTALQDLNDKYKNLQPYLEQIDQIEENVSNLEQAAYKLDVYSKRLESKFRTLEKR